MLLLLLLLLLAATYAIDRRYCFQRVLWAFGIVSTDVEVVHVLLPCCRTLLLWR
jgi:hypothetical protein